MSRAAASARSVSTETPSQTVPNLDHLVTQWMSAVTGSRGSAWNSSQVHRAVRPPGSRSVKSHVPGETRGVGPAESTGKSRVSYWPGGSRSAATVDRGRPRNPRENSDVILATNLSFLSPVAGHPALVLLSHHAGSASPREAIHRVGLTASGVGLRRAHQHDGRRPRLLLHNGSSPPDCSFTMYSAYQSGQFSSRSPVRASCLPCASDARRSACARSYI